MQTAYFFGLRSPRYGQPVNKALGRGDQSAQNARAGHRQRLFTQFRLSGQQVQRVKDNGGGQQARRKDNENGMGRMTKYFRFAFHALFF